MKKKTLSGSDFLKEAKTYQSDLKKFGEITESNLQQIDEIKKQGDDLYMRGSFRQAIPHAIKYHVLISQKLGGNSSEYVESISSLAMIYLRLFIYLDAELLAKQTVKIVYEASGDNHPDYARQLNNLGGVYQEIDKYDDAESCFKNALKIQYSEERNNEYFIAHYKNNLGLLYTKTGIFAEAEPLLIEAMKMRLKFLGQINSEYASSLDNLMRLKLFVQFHSEYASSLNNLALLYSKMGNLKDAEKYYIDACEIMSKIPNFQNHPNYAISLNSLGILYLEKGNYSAAMSTLITSMAILSHQGADHPSYANILTSLADLHKWTGNYDEAERNFLKASEIMGKFFSENHPEYARMLNNLAKLYQDRGRYQEAEDLFNKALKIIDKKHPSYKDVLMNLAVLYISTDRLDEAHKLMNEVIEIEDRMIGEIFRFTSEKQRLSYLSKQHSILFIYLSLFIKGALHTDEIKLTCLELIIKRKAIVADFMAAERDVILADNNAALKEKSRKLSTLRCQIAQKSLAIPDKEGYESYKNTLAEWNKLKESLEKELAREIPEMNIEQKFRSASSKAVSEALPDGSVLIEFVHFIKYDFKAVLDRGEKVWKLARYMACILPAGKPEDVKIIDLGEAEPVERMIERFRISLSNRDEATGSEGPASELFANYGAELRKAVFDPLMPALDGSTRLFIASDGELSHLPFETLPVDNSHHLIDFYQFSYLSAGRDILRFHQDMYGTFANSVVIADPDFNLSFDKKRVSPSLTGSCKRQSREVYRGGIHFEPLPGSLDEGKKIAKLLHVKPWLKEKALEGKLKASSSPRILHIATHGYFLKNQFRDPNRDLSGIDDPFLLYSGLENPMLRSGLALAGANTSLKKKPLPPEAEDAILNAVDVSALDLSGTEMVVLSACETALGEIQNGEGVFGLRRAFVLAGAKTLVMSLWKVPDKQTKELMIDFYTRILRGESRAEALRQAQLTMKKKYSNPLYWGAFICQGDPGPLVSADSDIQTPIRIDQN